MPQDTTKHLDLHKSKMGAHRRQLQYRNDCDVSMLQARFARMEFEDGAVATTGAGRPIRPTVRPKVLQTSVPFETGRIEMAQAVRPVQPPPKVELKSLTTEGLGGQVQGVGLARLKIEPSLENVPPPVGVDAILSKEEGTPEGLAHRTAWGWVYELVDVVLSHRIPLHYLLMLPALSAVPLLFRHFQESLWCSGRTLALHVCPIVQRINGTATPEILSLTVRILWLLVQSTGPLVHLSLFIAVLLLGVMVSQDVKRFASWLGILALMLTLAMLALAWTETDTRCIVIGACSSDAVDVLPGRWMDASGCPTFATVENAWNLTTASLPRLEEAFERVRKESVLSLTLADETRRYLAQLAHEPFVIGGWSAEASTTQQGPTHQEGPSPRPSFVSGLEAYLAVLQLQVYPLPEAPVPICPIRQADLDLEIKRHLVVQISKWIARASRRPQMATPAIVALSRQLHQTEVEILHTQTELGHWELCFQHMLRAGREPKLVPWRVDPTDSQAAQVLFAEIVRPAGSKRWKAAKEEGCRRFRRRQED